LPIEGYAQVTIIFASERLLVYEVRTTPPDKSGELVAYDVAKRRVKWRQEIPPVLAARACGKRDMLAIITEETLAALSMSSGKEIWRADLKNVPRTGKPSLYERVSAKQGMHGDESFDYTEYRLPLIAGSCAIVARSRIRYLGCMSRPLWDDWLAYSIKDGTIVDRGPQAYAGHTDTHVIFAMEDTNGGPDPKTAFPAIFTDRRASPVEWPITWVASNMSPYARGACGLARDAAVGGWALLVYTSRPRGHRALPEGRWPRYWMDWALAPRHLIEFTKRARYDEALPFHATVYDLDGTKAASRRLSGIRPHAHRWLTWVGADGAHRAVFKTFGVRSVEDASRALVYSLPGLALISSWELSPRPAVPETCFDVGATLGASGVMCEVVGDGIWWKMPADVVPHRLTFNFRKVIGGADPVVACGGCGGREAPGDARVTSVLRCRRHRSRAGRRPQARVGDRSSRCELHKEACTAPTFWSTPTLSRRGCWHTPLPEDSHWGVKGHMRRLRVWPLDAGGHVHSTSGYRSDAGRRPPMSLQLDGEYRYTDERLDVVHVYGSGLSEALASWQASPVRPGR
jgi:hypothetical protein